ncbi:hypothetical protein ACRRTK_004949 [Alexandromys fortis]
MQHTHLEHKVDLLRQEKKKLRDDWVLLMRYVEDLKVLCKNQEENGDVKTQQQQELQGLVQRLQFLLKQKEADTQKKDLAEKLQHHFEFFQMSPKHSSLRWKRPQPRTRATCRRSCYRKSHPLSPIPSNYGSAGINFILQIWIPSWNRP